MCRTFVLAGSQYSGDYGYAGLVMLTCLSCYSISSVNVTVGGWKLRGGV